MISILQNYFIDIDWQRKSLGWKELRFYPRKSTIIPDNIIPENGDIHFKGIFSWNSVDK